MKNELMKQYEELKRESFILMGMSLAGSDIDLLDPNMLKALELIKKCIDFSDLVFAKQIEMMEKVDKIYECVVTKN